MSEVKYETLTDNKEMYDFFFNKDEYKKFLTTTPGFLKAGVKFNDLDSVLIIDMNINKGENAHGRKKKRKKFSSKKE